jgi:hypothetical protein
MENARQVGKSQESNGKASQLPKYMGNVNLKQNIKHNFPKKKLMDLHAIDKKKKKKKRKKKKEKKRELIRKREIIHQKHSSKCMLLRKFQLKNKVIQAKRGD